MMVSADEDPRKAGSIWVFDLSQDLPAASRSAQAAYRRADGASAAILATAMGGVAADEVERRFAAGRRCYAAWASQALAAYGWVSFDDELIGELSLRMKLLPGEAYIWDCATLPAFRGQRLYTTLLIHILRVLKREGLQRAWIGANLDNQPSQRGIASAGFRRVADMVVERVLTLRMVWVRGEPGVPESLVAEARRAFLGGRDQPWLNALSSIISGGAR